MKFIFQISKAFGYFLTGVVLFLREAIRPGTRFSSGRYACMLGGGQKSGSSSSFVCSGILQVIKCRVFYTWPVFSTVAILGQIHESGNKRRDFWFFRILTNILPFSGDFNSGQKARARPRQPLSAPNKGT